MCALEIMFSFQSRVKMYKQHGPKLTQGKT